MLNMSASGLAYTLTTILTASEYPFGWLNSRVNLAVATLCSKQSLSPVLQAQAVALTVAQAFTIAFELWQVAKEGRSIKKSLSSQSVEELLYRPLRLPVFALSQR